MRKGGESYHSKVSIRALVSEEKVENSVKEINHLQQNHPRLKWNRCRKIRNSFACNFVNCLV